MNCGCRERGGRRNSYLPLKLKDKELKLWHIKLSDVCLGRTIPVGYRPIRNCMYIVIAIHLCIKNTSYILVI